MIKVVTSDKLIRYKLWIFFTLALCFAFFAIKPVFAQESSSSAEPAVKKYKITFPISTLGNCEDLQSCVGFCADPTNKEACVNFAKSKGFYKEPPKSQGLVRARLLLEKAKTELGCTTEQECKDFCKDQANKEKCASFAKKYNINTDSKRLIGQTILEKAKSALGCTTEESCKALCKEAKNQEKCSQFARMAGLPGGLIKIASMSGKNMEGFEQVKKIIEKCKENATDCQQNIDQIEKELMQKSNDFCKNNLGKCKELEHEFKKASDETRILKDKIKQKPATGSAQKKEMERKEIEKGELKNNLSGKPDKIQFKDQFEIKNPQVQGVSTVRSLFDQVFDFFFK